MFKKVAVIIPIYNEEDIIENFLYDLKKYLEHNFKTKILFEYIFVNDGSNDNSIDKLEKICSKDKSVKAINFIKNYGKEIALSAGIKEAFKENYDAYITMDCDYQHPIVNIKEFIEKWQDGFLTIIGLRIDTKNNSLFRSLGSKFFNYIQTILNLKNSSYNNTDFRLVDKKIAENFCKFNENERIFRGLMDEVSYKIYYSKFSAPERKYGKTKFSLKSLIKLFIINITGFSSIPIVIGGILGLIIFTISILLISYYFLSKIFLDQVFLSNLGLTVLLNTFLISIVLIFNGVYGLYLYFVIKEVRSRPMYLIKDKINF